MPQNKVNENKLDDTQEQAQAYNLQQPIFINQLPIVQNQQLIYQVEGVQNNVNLPIGSNQQNFVYIVIPTTSDSVENVPTGLLKKDKSQLSIATLQKSDSNDSIKHQIEEGDVIICDQEKDDANRFLIYDPIQVPQTLPQQPQITSVTSLADDLVEQPDDYIITIPNPNEENKGILRTHGYKCDYPPCNMAFSSIYEKKAHLDSHLFPENTEFKCNICNLVFSRAVDRNKHVETHSVVNTFKCHNCKQGFPYYTSLVKHLDSNKCVTTNKLFACYFCGSKFVTTGDLEMHQRENVNLCICKAKICGEQAYAVHINLCSVYKTKSAKFSHLKSSSETIILD